MEAFLGSLPQKLSLLRDNKDLQVMIVLGNESCDLDSAVCALVYAHYWSSRTLAIPMLNIPRADIPLKTEVNFCIGEEKVAKIPCRDDLELRDFVNLKLILVDHHVLAPKDANLTSKVVEIIDHREVNDAIKNYDETCNIKIELVGSCTTLISEILLGDGYNDCVGLGLIRSTIVTDTANLSQSAKKATFQDKQALENLEKILPSNLKSRRKELAEIKKAKRSIEGFTVEQLLRKDLKIVYFPSGVVVAAPSTLVLAKDIAGMNENMEEVFNVFCKANNAQMLIIMGHNYQRDILIYHMRTQDDERLGTLAEKIAKALCSHSEIGASVTKEMPNIPRVVHIEQANVTFTRKKLLPVILSVQNL